jgi:hypothetical protein
MSRKNQGWGVGLRLLFAACATVGAASAQGTVTCSSNDGGRHYCSAPNGAVQMVRQRSGSPCVRGETWGADANGIWVDRGCRADFAVQRGRRGNRDGYYGTDNGNYDRGDRDRDDRQYRGRDRDRDRDHDRDRDRDKDRDRDRDRDRDHDRDHDRDDSR